MEMIIRRAHWQLSMLTNLPIIQRIKDRYSSTTEKVVLLLSKEFIRLLYFQRNFKKYGKEGGAAEF